jgi:hypothetical protein
MLLIIKIIMIKEITKTNRIKMIREIKARIKDKAITMVMQMEMIMAML